MGRHYTGGYAYYLVLFHVVIRIICFLPYINLSNVVGLGVIQ